MDEHDLALMNEALAELGVDPIDSFDETSNAAQWAKRRYPTIKDSALGREAWSFARKREPLTLIEDRGTDEVWQYAFRRPADMVTPGPTNVVFENDIAETGSVDFDLQHINDELVIVCNDLEIHAIYTARVGMEHASPAFKEFLVLRLAEAACVPLTGDEDHRRVIRSQMYPSNSNAVGAWSNLLNSDADSRPAGTFAPSPFGFSGGRRRRFGRF